MQQNCQKLTGVILTILLTGSESQTLCGADLPDAPPEKSDSQTKTTAEAIRDSGEIPSKIGRLVASGRSSMSRRYFDMARSDFREALAISQQRLGMDHSCTHASQTELRHLEWVEDLSEQDFTEYLRLCRTTNNGSIYVDPERRRETATEVAAAIKILERLKSPPTSMYKTFAMLRSEALFGLGASKEGLEAAMLTRQLILQTEGPQSLLSGAASSRIATVLLALGDYQTAAREYTRACRERIATGQKDSGWYAELCLRAAILFNALGDERRAFDSLNAGREVIERLAKNGDENLADDVLFVECMLLANSKKYEELLQKAAVLIEVATRSAGADSHFARNGEMLRAWAYRNLGDPKGASPLLGDSYAKVLSISPDNTEGQRMLINIHAQHHVDLGSAAEAIKILEPRIEEFRKQSENYLGLHGLLQTYAQALGKVGRTDEAKHAEAESQRLKARVAEQRKLIESDPLCKFPWEG